MISQLQEVERCGYDDVRRKVEPLNTLFFSVVSTRLKEKSTVVNFSPRKLPNFERTTMERTRCYDWKLKRDCLIFSCFSLNFFGVIDPILWNLCIPENDKNILCSRLNQWSDISSFISLFHYWILFHCWIFQEWSKHVSHKILWQEANIECWKFKGGLLEIVFIGESLISPDFCTPEPHFD